MIKRPAVNKKRNKRAVNPDLQRESQISVAVTVFWMLSALATLAGELMWVVTRLLTRFFDSPIVDALSRLSLFIGAVTAICALVTTPIVFKVRQSRPPNAITWGVLLIATVALGLVTLGSVD